MISLLLRESENLKKLIELKYIDYTELLSIINNVFQYCNRLAFICLLKNYFDIELIIF